MKARIPKSPLQRVEECETHLYFLWDARQLYPQERDRYKQIASELRVLVGDHRPKRRLLLCLMEEYGFTHNVEPPRAPIHAPIPLVGWKNDPEQTALAAEIGEAVGDEERLKRALEKQAALARPVPFSEYVERALAVYIAPFDYSYRDLVLAVAQQVGSSHEDEAMDEPLVRLRQVVIGGSEGHVAPLISFADLVLRVGASFMSFLVEEHGYRPKYFQVSGRGHR
jgi:hypothetical protein